MYIYIYAYSSNMYGLCDMGVSENAVTPIPSADAVWEVPHVQTYPKSLWWLCIPA